MAVKMSWLAPRVALVPALAVTFVAFFLSIVWTIYMSFTASRRLPDYGIDFSEWGRQYNRLFNDGAWATSLKNLVILGVGSTLAIAFGFLLAVLVNREKHGEGIFRTIFLYPLAVSLVVTGLVWRWMMNPGLGIENFLHQLGWHDASFNWLDRPADTAMYGIILAQIWQSTGFYMALMLAGLKSINTEIWSAARLDGVSSWRLYIEIIIPMMRFTFLTCAILLSLGVVKAYDIVVAMTNGGPGQSTWTPAYFTINAYSIRSNIGFASAAAVIMLLITLVIFLPIVRHHRLAAAPARRRSHDRRQAQLAERRDRRLPAPQAAHHAARRSPAYAFLDHLRAVLRGAALRDRRHVVQDDAADHRRRHLLAAARVDGRALVQGVEHAVHRPGVQRHQVRLFQLAEDPDAEHRHLDRRSRRSPATRWRCGTCGGRTPSCSSCSCAPSCRSRSS